MMPTARGPAGRRAPVDLLLVSEATYDVIAPAVDIGRDHDRPDCECGMQGLPAERPPDPEGYRSLKLRRTCCEQLVLRCHRQDAPDRCWWQRRSTIPAWDC